MKNYNETINSVFERINEYEVEKKRKRKTITRTITSLCCFCFVALAGISVWRSGWFQSNPPTVLDEGNSTLQETEQKNDAIPDSNESNVNISDADIIWKDSDIESSDMGYTEWNGKRVTISLYTVLSDEKNKDVLIAIGIGFERNDEFIHNGKSIAEYALEAQNESLLYEKLALLLKLGDELKYGEDLCTVGTPDGIKWAKQLYDETIETLGKDLLAKYIVDREFLKDKLQSDIEKYDNHKPCQIAYEAACQAHYQFAVNTATEYLESQNISYENRSNDSFIIYATADELRSLSIDNVLFWCLATKDDDGTDLATTEVKPK